MRTDPTVDRRSILRTGGITAAGGTVAGCTGSDGRGTTNEVAGRSRPATGGESAVTTLDGLTEPVGWAGHYTTSVDPADYEDDSAAIQALVDDLFENMGELTVGHVILPQVKADGSMWSFPRTVSFGSDADRPGRDDGRGVVLPHGRGTRVRTSIDDGSPVFHLDPAHTTKPGEAGTFGGFTAGGGTDAEFVRVTSVIGWELKDLWLGGLARGPASTAAIVADANSYNFFLYNVHWWGGGGTEADVIGDDNSRDVRNPATDGHFMLDIHGECRNGVNISTGGRHSIAGHIEGASNAGVKSTGTITITDETWFYNTHDENTNQVELDDCIATLGNFYAGRCTGDLVSLGPDMHQFHVEPFTVSWGNLNDDQQSGAAIAIADGAGTGSPLTSTVPFPEQLSQPFDLAPIAGNQSIVFPNGAFLLATGTLEVPAGRTRGVDLSSHAGSLTGGALDVQYTAIDSERPRVTQGLRYDDADVPAVTFRERGGAESASIEYRIFQHF
jgi:hypothetical protein